MNYVGSNVNKSDIGVDTHHFSFRSSDKSESLSLQIVSYLIEYYDLCNFIHIFLLPVNTCNCLAVKAHCSRQFVR